MRTQEMKAGRVPDNFGFRRLLRTCRPFIVFGAALVVAACGSYQPTSRVRVDEVPPGPGLFTGKDGAFYVVGGPTSEDGSQKKDGK